MVAVSDKPGHFSVIMTYYYNEAQTANRPLASSDVVIFRKSDGKQMAQFTLPNTTLTNRPAVAFTNPDCARQNNLQVSQVVYKADIQLDPNEYTDPQGYYLIQQNCCRNATIANLINPQTTPFLFYLEFPALLITGQVVVNSSPVFLPLTGDYICVGSPFTFSTAARDADGDALRYSLVSPLAGTFTANTAVIKPAPYPAVNWRAGFNAQQAIPGNPALAIDARTGLLSVKASQQGLFAFSVRVEELRNGVKIGEVRRDLQLLVIDCPTTALSTPIIQIQNQPVGTTEALLCAGKPVMLQTTANADWTYQWDKNGIPINRATNSELSVLEPGEYGVTVALASGCSQRLRSGNVRINDASASTPITFDSIPRFCGADQPPVQLKGTPAGGVFSGKGIEGDLFYPDVAGVGTHELAYTLQSTANQCYSGRAQRRAVIGSAPIVELPAELTVDKGGSVDLQPTMTGQPVRFLWEPAIYLTASDQPAVRAVSVDTDVLYTLTATDEAGCRGMDSVRVRVFQRLWVPDAFSPNGDGLNDTWQLTGIEAYPQARLIVYNRWGQAVYQSVGYDRPFDGTNSGKSLPMGTYPYVLHPAPNSPSLKGSVLLIR
ncbi:hypothetical protein GCM10027423_06130 [Spirosoma arcticum]